MSNNINKEVTDKYRNLFLERENKSYKKAFEQLKDKFPELVNRGLPKVSIGGINCEVNFFEFHEKILSSLKIYFSYSSGKIDYKLVECPLELGEFLEKVVRNNYFLRSPEYLQEQKQKENKKNEQN